MTGRLSDTSGPSTMAPRRRHRGGRGGATWTPRLVLIGLVAFFLVGTLVPTGAFSLVDAGRVGTFGVADDANAELGLMVYSCVEKNTLSPLVTVTNDLESGITVTVALNDPTIGTLYVGNESGSSVTFSLAVGGSDTVDIVASVGGPYPKPFSFDIDAVGTDVSVAATRSSQVDKRCPN